MNTRERHACYYLALLQKSGGRWQKIEAELDQIRRAWAWIKDKGDANLRLSYIWAMQPFFEQSALWAEAIEWYQCGLVAAQSVNHLHDVGSLWNNLGTAWYALNNWDKSWECYQQAQSTFQQLDDRVCQAKSLNGLGLVCQAKGELIEALQYYEQASTLFRAENDVVGEATVLHNMGQLYASLEQWNEAFSFYERALELRRAQGDPVAIGLTLNNLAAACRSKSDMVSGPERESWLTKALNYGRQAQKLFAETGHRFYEAVALGNLGELAQHLERFDDALAYGEQALRRFREIGAPLQEAISLANLGNLYSIIGDVERAIIYNEQALASFEALERRAEQVTLLNNIANMYQIAGHLDAALTYRTRALNLCQELGDKNTEAETLMAIGDVYLRTHEFNLARQNIEQARDLFRSIANHRGEVIALNNLALALQFQGQDERCHLLYDEALRLAHSIGDRELAEIISHNMSRLSKANRGTDDRS
jgi:tetratricopeptide (TPR) repeat protein